MTMSISNDLENRLGAGIAKALADSDPKGPPPNYFAASRHQAAENIAWAVRRHIHNTNFGEPSDGESLDMTRPETVEGRVNEIADALRRERRAFLTLLFQQNLLPGVAAALVNTKGVDDVSRWAAASWIAEAAWSVVAAREGANKAFASTDMTVLRPLAARLRFITLSEPYRSPSSWLTDDEADPYGLYGLVAHVFGSDSLHLLSGNCREAREEWLGCMDSYESQHYLANASGRQLEAELRMLAFAYGSRPLVVAEHALVRRRGLGQATPTREDERVALHVGERHLLPRFDLGAVIRACSSLGRRRAAPWLWWLLTLTCVIAAVTASVWTFLGGAWPVGLEGPEAGALAAASCYGLIAIGVVGFGRRWAMLWLLRLPATAAVGLVVLLALKAWVDVANWWAVGTLAAVAYGYLLIEVRNHGAGPVTSGLRSAAVWLVAAVHSFLVCLIGLVFVAPAVSERGRTVLNVLDSPHEDPGRLPLLLAMATSWCLAAGVVTQILWEDQPITAPLAHMRWRTEH